MSDSSSFVKPHASELVKLLVREYRLIIYSTLAIGIITASITLLIPNRYTATANLFPAQKPALGIDLFTPANGVGSLTSSLLGGRSTETDRFFVLLNSETMMRSVAQKFNLAKAYDFVGDINEERKTIAKLRERTAFINYEEGNFTISVQDEDPVKAKDMADYFIFLLNEMNVKINSNDAAKYREFIEKRYLRAVSDLDSLQVEFKGFQEANGIFLLEEQVSVNYEIFGDIFSQKMVLETEYEVLKQSFSGDSDRLKNAADRIRAIDKKIKELMSGSSEKFIVNFKNLSEIGLIYANLLFQIELQKEVLTFILPIYEQAKLEEVKALPSVSVVDYPVVPTKKSFPKRSIIVILSMLSAGVLLVFYLIVRHYTLSNAAYLRSFLR